MLVEVDEVEKKAYINNIIIMNKNPKNDNNDDNNDRKSNKNKQNFYNRIHEIKK